MISPAARTTSGRLPVDVLNLAIVSRLLVMDWPRFLLAAVAEVLLDDAQRDAHFQEM